MRSGLRLLHLGLVLFLAAPVLRADDPPTPPTPPPQFNPAAQAQIDVLMVSLPEEKALALLPELRDSKRIAGAQHKLLEMVARGEAQLLDWPQLLTLHENRAVTESIIEHRYPVEFEQPMYWDRPNPPPTPNEKALTLLGAAGAGLCTTYETKNVGATLEVEAAIAADGQCATINLAPQFVAFERMVEFPLGKDAHGNLLAARQPVFRTHKIQTNVTLRDGERRLIHVGKLQQPEDRIELFIMGLEIRPALETHPPAPPVVRPALTDTEAMLGTPRAEPMAALPQARIDVLMAWLPTEKALALLPDLRDPQRIEAAQQRLLAMIARKEAHLEDWPEVTTHIGARAESDAQIERRYPVDFQRPPAVPLNSPTPISAAQIAVGELRKLGLIVPMTFETQNAGTSLAVELRASRETQSVEVELRLDSQSLERMVEIPAGHKPNGEPVSVPQPLFRTHRVITNLVLRDGERRLLYVARPLEPSDRMYLYIAGAKIIPPTLPPTPAQPPPR